MLFPLLLLLLLPQCESEKRLCAPRNVTFSSVGLRNELIWLPPKNLKGVRYTVEYCECDCNYWQKKLDCTNITTTRCDLTNETRNDRNVYFGRVTATNQVCTQKSNQIQLLAPYTAEAGCAPRNVTFSSENMKNKLIWLPPKTIKGVIYTVEYFIYGTKTWKKKLDCTNITLTFCDLTNETSNKERQYYGRVIAKNQLCCLLNTTERFDPLHTTLGPPEVQLFPSGTSILINLSHPVKSLHSIYKTVEYQIKINDNDFRESKEPYYMLEYLDPQTTYCVTAKVSVFGNGSVFSNKTCATTKTDHISEQIVLLCIVPVIFFTFILLFAAAYGVHKYIHVSNVKQPHILNITTNNNNHAVLVEGNTVTINLITIDSGITNLKNTMMSGEEKILNKSDLLLPDGGENTMMSGEEKILNKSDLLLTDGGDDISHDSGVMEDDHGYISLQEQASITRSQLSPYDMPHNFDVETAKPITETLCLHEEQDLYGHLKSTPNISSQQENHDFKVSQNSYTSNRTMAAYLPKNDHIAPKLENINNDLCKLEEFEFLEPDSENWNGNIYEGGTLFLDWSPKSSRLYIPELCNDVADEFCKEECNEVNEGLLSQLDMPLQPQENPEKDELVQLAERWGLNIQM